MGRRLTALKQADDSKNQGRLGSADSKCCGQGGFLEEAGLRWVLTGGPVQLIGWEGCGRAATCSVWVPGEKLGLHVLGRRVPAVCC